MRHFWYICSMKTNFYSIMCAILLALVAQSCQRETKRYAQITLSYSGDSPITSCVIYEGSEVVQDLGAVPLNTSEDFNLEQGKTYTLEAVTSNVGAHEDQTIDLYISFGDLFRHTLIVSEKNGDELIAREDIAVEKY